MILYKATPERAAGLGNEPRADHALARLGRSGGRRGMSYGMDRDYWTKALREAEGETRGGTAERANTERPLTIAEGVTQPSEPANSIAGKPAAPVTSPMHLNGVPEVAATVRADFDLRMLELCVEVAKGVGVTFRLPIEGALEPALRIIAKMRHAPVDRPWSPGWKPPSLL